MEHHRLDGRRVAAELLETSRAGAQTLAAAGWQPHLVSVSIGQSDAVTVAMLMRNTLTAARRQKEYYENEFAPRPEAVHARP